MSDLCHNCGDCHLGAVPSPCAQTMNHCTICGYWGHTYNFCPQGVHKMEPGYLVSVCRAFLRTRELTRWNSIGCSATTAISGIFPSRAADP